MTHYISNRRQSPGFGFSHGRVCPTNTSLSSPRSRWALCSYANPQTVRVSWTPRTRTIIQSAQKQRFSPCSRKWPLPTPVDRLLSRLSNSPAEKRAGTHQQNKVQGTSPSSRVSPSRQISPAFSCPSTLVLHWMWSRAIQPPKVPSMPLSSLHMILSISLPGLSVSFSSDSQRSVASTSTRTPILGSPTRRIANRRRRCNDHRGTPIPVIRSQDLVCVHVFQMELSPRRPSSIRFTCKQTKLNLRTDTRK